MTDHALYAALAALPFARLHGDATDTDLLSDLGLDDLHGRERDRARAGVRRVRARLDRERAAQFVETPCLHCDGEGTQPCNDCTGGGCATCDDDNGLVECDDCDGAGVDAVTARTLEAEAQLQQALQREREVRDHALGWVTQARTWREYGEGVERQAHEAMAMVGGQDGDDLEARLRYALAVGGARPGETLIDAGARASAERDDLRAQFDAAELELSIRQTRGDEYQRRAVEAERDREQLQADLVLARRSWWRRLLDWWGGLP